MTVGGEGQPPPAGGAGGDPRAPGPSPFHVAPRAKGISRFFPLLGQLRNYRSLRTDVLSGIIVATLAVPQSMAYAQTAGLPVVIGLYGLILPLIAFAILSSSPVLMVGPTTTAALMVAPALVAASSDESQYPALAAMLALLVAAVFLMGRVLSLGWIADYFSTAVLLGFVTGLALTLVAGQVGVMFGVSMPGGTPLQQYGQFLGNVVGGTHGLTLAVGAITLTALLAGSRWFPRFPTLLVLTVAALLLSWLLDLPSRGVAIVGEIPAGLPRITLPSAGLGDAMQLLPAAVGIAFVGFSDAILTARSLSPEKPIDADQELLALAGLNAAAGVTGSFPLGGSGSRSAVNVRLGGRTQVVSVVLAVTAIVALLFLTPALAYMPKAFLAAIIIYAAIGLLDVPEWLALARGSRGELFIAGVTVLGMLTVGLLPALGLAVLLSMIDVARLSSQPRDAVLGWSAKHGRFVDVEPRHDAVLVPGVVVYRLDDRLFFANSRYFAARITQAVQGSPTPVKVVVFDAEVVSHMDSTAAATITAVVKDLDAQGIRFVVARPRAQVRDQIDRMGLADVLPPESRFATVRAAVLATSGVDVQTLTPS